MSKKRSLARRYFSSVTVVVLSSMILLASIFFTIASQYFRSENLGNLTAALDCVSKVLGVAEKEVPDEDFRQALVEHSADLASEITGATLLITDENGTVVYCSDELELTETKLPAQVLETIPVEESGNGAGQKDLRDISDLGGTLKHRYYVAGRYYSSPVSGTCYLLALSGANRFAGYLSDLIFSFLWASMLMLLVSGLMALLTARNISAPLAQISKAADRFGKGDFSARVSVEKGGNDEVAQLAQNFNTMANSLEAIDRSRQSFMGNIAHELRTPMTSIKGFIDGMLDGVIPPEQYPRYLGLVSDEVGRLTRLIQSMLDITKLEAGEYAVNAKNYDIWETVGAVLMNNEQRLTEGHIGVVGFVPQRTLVYADPDLIYQVVYNIVDNAIKFTPPGGQITLNITAMRERVYISIRNTGEGVPAEQLPYLFERFYKGDKSRGLHASGAGLGMHISKVLIGVSGGSIRVDSDSASWTEFSFDLPQGLPELPPPRKERSGKGSLIKFRSKNRQ